MITEGWGIGEKRLPNEQVMAEQNLREGNLQMSKGDVNQMSKVASLRIVVQEAIRRYENKLY